MRAHLRLAAYMTAGLMRTRRLPSLQRWLNPPKARALKGPELKQRQTEFEAMAKRMGADRIGV